MIIFNKNETNNNQVHPDGQREPSGIVDQVLLKYIILMGLLFDIIGYGPIGILAAVDYQLRQSVAVYAALEILPSLCLLIDIGLLYIINKEIRKKITSICRRQD